MVDRHCEIIDRAYDALGHLLLHHDCAATRGVSGAPVLAQESGEWRIIGVDIAAEIGAASGIAVGIADVMKELKAE
jgi:protease YdgD